ncbi:MAG: hypothetical protein CVT68_03955 [Actinobacteria bacterium HGW-Actinobacteria-8]|nr:MAG: hypothetical protein CVT68_03955 [Actinobacteria bacterium HGW-Actinobacteria-8]
MVNSGNGNSADSKGPELATGLSGVSAALAGSQALAEAAKIAISPEIGRVWSQALAESAKIAISPDVARVWSQSLPDIAKIAISPDVARVWSQALAESAKIAISPDVAGVWSRALPDIVGGLVSQASISAEPIRLDARFERANAIASQLGTYASVQEEFGRSLSDERFPSVANELADNDEVSAQVAALVGQSYGTGERGSSDTVVEVTRADIVMTAVFLATYLLSVVVWLKLEHPDVYGLVVSLKDGLEILMVAFAVMQRKSD